MMAVASGVVLFLRKFGRALLARARLHLPVCCRISPRWRAFCPPIPVVQRRWTVPAILDAVPTGLLQPWPPSQILRAIWFFESFGRYLGYCTILAEIAGGASAG